MNVLQSFRRLKWNEVVRAGDFVADDQRRLKPLEGLMGFQADSYLAAVYRRRILGIADNLNARAHA